MSDNLRPVKCKRCESTFGKYPKRGIKPPKFCGYCETKVQQEQEEKKRRKSSGKFKKTKIKFDSKDISEWGGIMGNHKFLRKQEGLD